MPNDPMLMPTMGGPQDRLLQKMAALEARVWALEKKRDMVFTPFNVMDASVGSPTTQAVPYHGGRLWIVTGASLYRATGKTAFASPLTATGDIALSGTVVLSGVSATAPASWSHGAGPVTVWEVTGDQRDDLTPGNLTLGVAATSGVFTYADNFYARGLLLEWPQA